MVDVMRSNSTDSLFLTPEDLGKPDATLVSDDTIVSENDGTVVKEINSKVDPNDIRAVEEDTSLDKNSTTAVVEDEDTLLAQKDTKDVKQDNGASRNDKKEDATVVHDDDTNVPSSWSETADHLYEDIKEITWVVMTTAMLTILPYAVLKMYAMKRGFTESPGNMLFGDDILLCEFTTEALEFKLEK
ncbi:hypothetical protein WDU94_012949 [Cyamophila willieti]